MKRAILHIGTEKTGTTSIQKFLFENRSKLSSMGLLFPASAGFISNQRLVVYGKQAPEPDLADESLDVSDSVQLDQWKEQFVLEHCSEILAFQARHTDASSVIYSAEHLQSRLTRIDEIKRIARLLRPLFDEVRVLVYLRRQDRYALSAHSTSVRGGNPNTFAFEKLNAVGPYYDYRMLLEQWSEVFGADAIDVRVFEKAQLHGGDVVTDFCKVTGIDDSCPSMVKPESENEALSHTALMLLRRFNALAANDPTLLEYSKTEIRPYLLGEVQRIQDPYGRVLPSRSSAVDFYEQFREDNQWIAEQWLNGKGFNEDFHEYPETASTPPALDDLDERLSVLIDEFSHSRMGYATRIGRAIKQRVSNG